MVISEKELKKRAEHNYGRLHDLEEVKYVTYVDVELFANDQIPLQNTTLFKIQFGQTFANPFV